MLRLANCIAMLLCISCGDDRRDPAAARQHFDLTVKLPLNAIAKSKFSAGVHLAGRGYGSAVLGGIQAARGKYVIMGDSVDSYEFSRLDVFVEWLRAGFRPVMG